MRLPCGFVILALGAVACTDVKHSTLPPFVRDIRATYGGLELIQCEIVLTTKREHTMMSGQKTEREVSVGQCWNQVVSTEPPIEEQGGPR